MINKSYVVRTLSALVKRFSLPLVIFFCPKLKFTRPIYGGWNISEMESYVFDGIMVITDTECERNE